MYKLRLYIFIFLCILAMSVCLSRLGYLQLAQSGEYREEIEQMRILAPVQLPTLRGTIFDRNHKPLAIDRPAFYLHVKYELTRLMDDRFWQARTFELLSKDETLTKEEAEIDLRTTYEKDRAQLMHIINRFAELEEDGRDKMEEKIRQINNRIWKSREFHAWAHFFPNSPIREKYRKMNRFVPLSKALEEYYSQIPDENQRALKTIKSDLAAMYEYQPLIELVTEQELLEAQLAFVDVEGVEIFPEAKRVYPMETVGCQIIGWVGPAHEEDNELFEEDDYSRYLHGEVIGREGIEWACEVVLRGKRGEIIRDIDGNVIGRKPAVFGKDVSLTLDIDLQHQLENLISDPNGQDRIGAVVLDAKNGDVLAMASVPVYDLNTVRQNYSKLLKADGNPLLNKSYRKTYPPGSVMKPLICIFGLEEGKVSPWEVISCPYERAPRGWPNCLQFSRFHGCHDWKWEGSGGNRARNAIKGSCNIYFSQLANRLPSLILQEWMFNFGLGHKALQEPPFEELLGNLSRKHGTSRILPEAQGQISSIIPRETIVNLEDVPELKSYEKRMFGIGQGSLRVTPLQIANAYSAFVRGGHYKPAKLFQTETILPAKNLHLSETTIKTVLDGMYAVVNESGGTAYKAFKNSPLLEKETEMKIYGKTGSTEKPYHAWFAGFVEDKQGRAITLAVLVEGGQAGSTDAAPVGRDIIRICNKAGYIGKPIVDKPSL